MLFVLTHLLPDLSVYSFQSRHVPFPYQTS